MRNIISLLIVALFLGACVSNPQRPVTLNQAIKAQANNPERALVFATYQEGEDGVSMGDMAKAMLFGKRENVPGIVFDGSPYDKNNKSPYRGLHVLDRSVGKDVVPAYQGNFNIMGNKNWAYVYPTQYAVSILISKHQKTARIGGWARSDRLAYLVFNVQPGEVLYLGHIRTNWVNDENIGFLIEDRFEEFRQILPESIRTSVQKRILKAPAYIRADNIEIERTLNYSSPQKDP